MKEKAPKIVVYMRVGSKEQLEKGSQNKEMPLPGERAGARGKRIYHAGIKL